MNKLRYLPIGIQTFEELRTKNYIYVDKTAFVDNIVRSGKPYFLSRPRRFGKSLFLSTLRSYFEGRKDLFEGLAISKTETEWKEYPVFYFDFTGKNYETVDDVILKIGDTLEKLENIYGKNTESDDIAIRFKNLIEAAYKKNRFAGCCSCGRIRQAVASKCR